MYGSLNNILGAGTSNTYAPTPAVGDGATVLHWTDRTSATVVEVVSPTHVRIADDEVTHDFTTRRSTVGAHGTGNVSDVRKGKNGQWKVTGVRYVVAFGVRDPYYDFEF